MKKILCSMFLAALIIFGATNCLAAEQDTYLIYKNADFEEHKVGELPAGFAWHYSDGYGFYSQEEDRITALNNTEIVTIEKDGNGENKAIKFNADMNEEQYDFSEREYQSSARAVFTYYPMKKNGVISFSFRVEDSSKEKSVTIGSNATTGSEINFADVDPTVSDLYPRYKRIFKIADGKLYYVKCSGSEQVSQTEIGTVANNTWYDVDFVVDITAGTGTVYFNGKATEVSLPDGLTNIYEVRFYLPTYEGDVWYIDDVAIYEADKVLDDETLDAAWDSYRNSSFYVGYEFEGSRAANYDYMAYLKCDGKRFSVINSNRLFDGKNVQIMSGKIYYEGDMLMLPVAAVAEALGAEVEISNVNGAITFTYDGTTVMVVPGSNVYNINGKPAKLLYPISEDGCMQSDLLLGFLKADYTIDDNILWFDQPNEFDWHMPLNASGNEITGTSSYTLEDNIYKRILHMLLYERPTNEEIAERMNALHPRIEFTEESLKEIMSKKASDTELKSFINAVIAAANTVLAYPQKTDANGEKLYYANGEPIYEGDLSWDIGDGKRISFGGMGNYIETLARGYLLSTDTDKKAEYKARIKHYMTCLGDETLFKDWGIYCNSGLGTGENIANGFARAIDWVDWDEKERAWIEEMCKRNILDHAIHSYTCTFAHNAKVSHHQFAYSEGNQATITNGGILLLAISLYELNPAYYGPIIRGALRATEGGTIAYFPYGEYEEGISYWRYASVHLASILRTLETSMNTTYSITDVPGVLDTAYFPFMMAGRAGESAYAYGDGQTEKADTPLMMYVGRKTGDKALAEHRKKNQQSHGKSITDIANWVSDTDGAPSVYDTDDVYNVANSTVIMKTGIESDDVAVSFHGGANNDGHGHWDIGSFQFDMNNVRFAVDLPREDYNLRDKGHYDMEVAKEMYPDGAPWTGSHYYRFKGEGHNTVIANRSVINAKELVYNAETKSYDRTGTYDMNGNARSEFIDMKFGEDESYAILNMTETNDIYECAIRGIKLDKSKEAIIVQDEFVAKEPTDFMWSMHTLAKSITLNSAKNQATLKQDYIQNGVTYTATIIAKIVEGDYKFAVQPAEFDTDYGDSLKPALETPNKPCPTGGDNCETHAGKCSASTTYQKLVIKTPNGEKVKDFNVMVVFKRNATSLPKYVPIELWGE